MPATMAWRVGELVRNFLHAAVLAIACSIGFKVGGSGGEFED